MNRSAAGFIKTRKITQHFFHQQQLWTDLYCYSTCTCKCSDGLHRASRQSSAR